MTLSCGFIYSSLACDVKDAHSGGQNKRSFVLQVELHSELQGVYILRVFEDDFNFDVIHVGYSRAR